MAPALIAEPLSPNDKLNISASVATGTRQSVRKLESPSVGGGGVGNEDASVNSDTSKKPGASVEAAATTAVAPTDQQIAVKSATTRVTRSKDVAKRTSSPIVTSAVNNKRKNKIINNKINDCGSGNSKNKELVSPSDDPMGLSAAPTHTSTDVSVASGSGSDATATPVATAAAEEHNNNNNSRSKANSADELLENLKDNFEETITAEICLRKTLDEGNIEKQQSEGAAPTSPSTDSATDPAQLLESTSMADDQQPKSKTSAAPELPASDLASALSSEDQMALPPIPSSSDTVTTNTTTTTTKASSINTEKASTQLESAVVAAAVDDDDDEIPIDNIEERLSQLDGGGSSVAIPMVAADMAAESLNASLMPASIQQQQQQSTQQLQPPQQQQQQQQPHQPDIHASPQSVGHRQSGVLLTPQSTSSSLNFLKDGTAGPVLEDQELEEVLKALNNFDGAHVNPETICDLSFLNEVCFEEDVAAVAAATEAAAAVAPSAVLNRESSPKDSQTVADPKPRPWQESHVELEKQQHTLNRKLEFLLRRMQKLSSRHMCRHVSDEVAGIFEWSARTSHKSTIAGTAASSPQALGATAEDALSLITGRPRAGYWEQQIKHPVPESQMSSVLRHIEQAARKQQICNTISGGSSSLASSSSWYSSTSLLPAKRPRKLQQNDGSSNGGGVNTATDGTVIPRSDEVVPIFDKNVTSELTHVSGLLHAELRELQSAIDSDATESSSGGDSADEMVNYNNSQQLSLPIARRAVWCYSRDRAAIALRWTWLRAQILDLNIKIRQHSDVYNDLNQSKGDALLEPPSTSRNGYKEPSGADGESMPSDWLCSRTRPLAVAKFRKRKLFQTINMHTISKKVARPSSIKCGCQWPQTPCAVCTGRPDPTAPRELPETLMPQNRVALLDPGYHPVLSFPSDVSQSVHLEAISRQSDWQYRVSRGQAKAIVKNVLKAEREAVAMNSGVTGGRRAGDTVKRRYVRRKERNNNRNTSNNNINNNNNNNNNNISNNNNNNNNSKFNKISTTMSTGQVHPSAGIVGLGGVGLDSGNGTGTATTSSSSTTPTTTPLVANMTNKRQRQPNKATGGSSSSTNSPLPEQHQSQHHQPQQNSPSLISSRNDAKSKSRKSASKQHHQQQQHSTHNNNNSSSSGHQWEQQRNNNNRRNSSETHARSADRRNRMYDIDNILIPYSIAAQTRVEILPYKEIPTPKWRRIVDKNGDEQSVSETVYKLAEEEPKETVANKSMPKKTNGLKQLKKDSKLSYDVQQLAEQPLINGAAINGNAETKIEEQQPKQQQPQKPNGKIKNNNKLNMKSAARDPLTTPATAPGEPPNKRAKLLPTAKDAVMAELTPGKAKDNDATVEDLTDEAYTLRHQQALLEEKRRFETFLKFPWSTRSRANRRVDSRAESSGANTPDPASPATPQPPGAPVGPDNDSIPSPLTQQQQQHPLDGITAVGESSSTARNQERRRTTSIRPKESSDGRSATPDAREMPQDTSSIEELSFPLSDEVYQQLQKEMMVKSKQRELWTYAPVINITAKRTKSKSVSSNGGGIDGITSSRRSSKANASTISKLAQTPTGTLNGVKGTQASSKAGRLNGKQLEQQQDTLQGDDDEEEEDEEDVELLLEEDDDYHYLAPPPEDEETTPSASTGAGHDKVSFYDTSIDAYLGDQVDIEEDELADPFRDDDPNDPEWKTCARELKHRRRAREKPNL